MSWMKYYTADTKVYHAERGQVILKKQQIIIRNKIDALQKDLANLPLELSFEVTLDESLILLQLEILQERLKECEALIL